MHVFALRLICLLLKQMMLRNLLFSLETSFEENRLFFHSRFPLMVQAFASLLILLLHFLELTLYVHNLDGMILVE